VKREGRASAFFSFLSRDGGVSSANQTESDGSRRNAQDPRPYSGDDLSGVCGGTALKNLPDDQTKKYLNNMIDGENNYDYRKLLIRGNKAYLGGGVAANGGILFSDHFSVTFTGMKSLGKYPSNQEILPAAGEYTFQMATDPSFSEDSVLQEVKNEADGTFTFDTIVYENVNPDDEFNYYFREVPGSDENIDYDDTIYKIAVTAESYEGSLTIQKGHAVKYESNSLKRFFKKLFSPLEVSALTGTPREVDFTFTNGVKEGEKVTKLIIGGVKNLDNEPCEKSGFTFALSDGSGNLIATAKNMNAYDNPFYDGAGGEEQGPAGETLDIAYTVGEPTVPEETATPQISDPATVSDSMTSYTVTNTRSAKVRPTVNKVWDQGIDTEGKTVTLQLQRNYSTEEQPDWRKVSEVTLNGKQDDGEDWSEQNATGTGEYAEWSGRFDEVEKYETNGSEIDYRVTETTSGDYNCAVSCSVTDGFTATNTKKPVASMTAVTRLDGEAPEGYTFKFELYEGNTASGTPVQKDKENAADGKIEFNDLILP
jgi:hypothetical protein